MTENKVYVIEIEHEQAVVVNGFEVYNTAHYISADDMAELIGNSLKTKPVTINATHIAEKTRDEWTWPDVIETAIEDDRRASYTMEQRIKMADDCEESKVNLLEILPNNDICRCEDPYSFETIHHGNWSNEIVSYCVKCGGVIER